MKAQSFKFRFYPTKQQEATLNQSQRVCLELQRLCVIERRQHDKYVERCKEAGREEFIYAKYPNFYSQSRLLTEILEYYPEWRIIPRDTLTNIVERVDEAQKRAIKDTKRTGEFHKVRWAKTHREIGLTFRGQVSRGTVMTEKGVKYGYWKLASSHKTLGTIKVRMHRPIPDGADVRQAHITRNALGWFISFSCMVPEQPFPDASTKNVTGVDVGCVHEGDKQRIAVTDDGHVYRTTDNLKRSSKRLALLQKFVSNRRVNEAAKHADPKSNRTKKRRVQIAKLHAKVARQREHTLQYTAKMLAESANVVAFEKLSLQGMRSKGKGRRKKGLNRSMSTAAPGRLISLTEEKAENRGREVVKVNAKNTSQICSACGALPGKKGLDVRVWTCRMCGTEHDRDVNAARNIARRAMNDTGVFNSGVPGEDALVLDGRSVNLEAA